VPQAQGTPVKLPVGEDSALLPSLLTLSVFWARCEPSACISQPLSGCRRRCGGVDGRGGRTPRNQ
jgi:hypothetical protein